MTCSCHCHNGFLTAKGLAEAAQRDAVGPELAGVVAKRYLDRVGSVSGSDLIDLHWDDAVIEEQHRRFINGS